MFVTFLVFSSFLVACCSTFLRPIAANFACFDLSSNIAPGKLLKSLLVIYLL